MLERLGQKIRGAWNDALAKHYFRRAVNAAIKKKYAAAYRYVEKSYRISPDDFKYVLLRGISAGINGEHFVAAESCASAYELLENSEIAERELEYLRTVAAFWANYYFKKLKRGTVFESRYLKHAEKLVPSEVSREWLYLFPASFLSNWEYPAKLDFPRGYLSLGGRRFYPQYLWSGAAFSSLAYLVTTDYRFAALAFLAGLLWEYVRIHIEVRRSR